VELRFFRVNEALYKLLGWLVRHLCFLKSLRQTFLELPALLYQPFNESQGKMLKMKALMEDVRGCALIKLCRILSNTPTAAYTCPAVLCYLLPGVTCLNLHFNAFIFIVNALSPKQLFTYREHRTKLWAIQLYLLNKIILCLIKLTHFPCFTITECEDTLFSFLRPLLFFKTLIHRIV